MSRRPGRGRRPAPGEPDTGPKRPKAEKPRKPAESWLWVEADGPGGRRIEPHAATLGFAAEGDGATIDLFAERGGRDFSGLTVQSLRVPRVRAARDLVGKEVVDPPPAVIGIGALGGPHRVCTGGGPHARSPLRRLGTPPAAPAAAHGEEPPPPEEEDIEAEEAAPDDDPALGDIETYRRRRAEEGKRETAAPEPELDEEAIALADAAAAAERALVFPDQAYEVTAIRLRFAKLEGRRMTIEVDGRCAAVGESGEIEREEIPFGGHLVAEVEEA